MIPRTLLALFALGTASVRSGAQAQSGPIIGWGDNFHGQASPPADTYIDFDAGFDMSVGVTASGASRNWGEGYPFGGFGPPPPVRVRAAAGRQWWVELRDDGTVQALGNGPSQVPPDLFTDIDAAQMWAAGLRFDGTLVQWGSVPPGPPLGLPLPTGSFVEISVGDGHAQARRADGTVQGWGQNYAGQAVLPAGNYIEVSAGGSISIGLRDDGTLVATGVNSYGLITNVPQGRFVAISAGSGVAAAIREDGTIVTWGNASTTWMAPPPGRFVRIACGANYCLAMRDMSCYANCDGSTAGPVLTVNDFMCYLNRFAAADPKANCDASTVPPVLNINDFVCFISTYAAGCSGP